MTIDVGFDFRTDTPPDRDPDALSPTLRRYHRLLWSKPLPNGQPFALDAGVRGHYLYHRSGDQEFSLSSDAVMQTFVGNTKPPYYDQLCESDNEKFRALAYTIGAMMVFPGNQIARQWTINQARGCRWKIRDRFDLTLECIRLHYEGSPAALNPLGDVLLRYDNFFALFADFSGYASFFLLQDLLNDRGEVRFFAAFDNFAAPAMPRDVDTYIEYRRCSIEFIRARNARVADWALSLAGDSAEGVNELSPGR